jgi:hypothetical protein
MYIKSKHPLARELRDALRYARPQCEAFEAGIPCLNETKRGVRICCTHFKLVNAPHEIAEELRLMRDCVEWMRQLPHWDADSPMYKASCAKIEALESDLVTAQMKCTAILVHGRILKPWSS